MGITERRDRERGEREARIVAAARAIAEAEGWAAVTIRRLAQEIEYSQPVLYSHFAGRDAIVAAVAVRGFVELAAAFRAAAARFDADAGADAGAARAAPEAAIMTVGQAYLAFSRAHPAVYEAMFSLPTGLRFARSDTEPELRDAFAALGAVAGPLAADPELATETVWGMLHGLASLERAGRIRPEARTERLALLLRGLLAGRGG